ncbi:hypothetical protein CROQUDRAFT_658593 [Cronartium quercuum f. sp. fusiforme G11]|uniref:3-hydroxyacyl-CoA dehydrogenase n=1 Tax=Cronartium quercuum f. sp. fusiforme G11 TaxID=708437 RepID=A0A9P6TBD2_9BASI|nr:hypothetical protein CROQUDRAFT_658593 [Cronartium quercuum f. sp. fusiforme G11]
MFIVWPVCRPLTTLGVPRLALSKCFSTSLPRSSHSIDHLTVVGAGLMGSGIAQVAAHAGLHVTLADTSQGAIDNGLKLITNSLTRVARKAHPDSESAQRQLVEETRSRISTVTEPERGASESELVVEAIVEKVKPKQELFKRLDSIAPPSCIFASNTSSLKISDIASATSVERQRKFAGLHYFNPVPQMKLVEIIRTNETDESTLESLTALCKRTGKVPVLCADTPGFIVNRLLVPYLLEAMRMLERGEATIEDIDTAMKLGAGYPMGPLELSDYVGLDTMKHISDGWRQSRVETGEIGSALVEPVTKLDELVAAGKLGRKSGQGFKKY